MKVPKEIMDFLKSIESDIRSCGFWACPGSDINRIEAMKTCSHCALIIRARRLIKKWKRS